MIYLLFYNACELLTYPSFYEGFGLPPLEAMACGTPVITSNVTSLPEIFYNSALLVNPYDVYALSYAMEKVLCDSLLKLTMVQKGLITSSNYSWKKLLKIQSLLMRKLLILNKLIKKELHKINSGFIAASFLYFRILFTNSTLKSSNSILFLSLLTNTSCSHDFCL